MGLLVPISPHILKFVLPFLLGTPSMPHDGNNAFCLFCFGVNLKLPKDKDFTVHLFFFFY
jgi:hypothetical protein